MKEMLEGYTITTRTIGKAQINTDIMALSMARMVCMVSSGTQEEKAAGKEALKIHSMWRSELARQKRMEWTRRKRLELMSQRD